jgi:twitching motility protein PilI
VRGNLYNISDLAQFLEMPPTPKSINNRILLLSTESTTQVALLVDSLVGLRSVQGMHLQPGSNDSNQLFSKQTYTDDDNNEWLELDIEALVHDKDFVQPT